MAFILLNCQYEQPVANDGYFYSLKLCNNEQVLKIIVDHHLHIHIPHNNKQSIPFALTGADITK